VCVRVCVFQRERGREGEIVCICMRVCVCACVRACFREGERERLMPELSIYFLSSKKAFPWKESPKATVTTRIHSTIESGSENYFLPFQRSFFPNREKKNISLSSLKKGETFF